MSNLITTLINSMTSGDFPSADVYAAQQTAHLYCSVKVGEDIAYTGNKDDASFDVTDDQQAMAIALLGVAILREGRRDIKSRTENIVVRTLDELFSSEMRSMLIIGDEVDADSADENVMWSNANPSEDWVVN